MPNSKSNTVPTAARIEPVDKLTSSIESLSEENLSLLCELDRKGFLIGKDEILDSYKKRLNNILNDAAELKNNLALNADFNILGRINISESDRISEKLSIKAKSIVNATYAFEPFMADAFYAKKGLGFFIGGCAITFDSGLSVILLRNSFRNKARWLFYSAKELVAHELCHSVRAPLNDNPIEEFFAYSVSPSPLRRYLGNCFRTGYDALLLLAPIFLLMVITFLKVFLVSSLDTLFFWILIFIYPSFLLIRNHFTFSTFRKAKKILEKFIPYKRSACPILFRCSYDEISAISKLRNIKEFNSFIKDKSETLLRWRVIKARFLQKLI
ncbi:MAG TPA: hypothetical protein DD381_04825 [Lentisphaeria bacterium]|nr:MAG: hypothetical protein A2X47_01735 [Lentisphaerae bacterium GWF2_38_69]HBM15653.1 hypothetical protein [Lentisphaeria bacterium]